MRFSELGLRKPIASHLRKHQIEDEQDLRNYLSNDGEHLPARTRSVLQNLLQAMEAASSAGSRRLPSQFQKQVRKPIMGRRAEGATVAATPPRTIPTEAATEPGLLFAQFEEAVEALFLDEPMVAEMLRDRLGLNNVPPQSLEQIGERLDMSSERLKKIEYKALKRIRRLFQLGASPDFQLHPVLMSFIKELKDAVWHSADRSVLTVDAYEANLREKVDMLPSLRASGLMCLILEWSKVIVAPYRAERTFVFRDMKPEAQWAFLGQLGELEFALQQHLEPVALRDLFEVFKVELNGLQMEPEDFLPLLDFQPEWLSEGVFQVSLGQLEGVSTQAVRILRELGEGLHRTELAERIAAAEGTDDLREGYLVHQMAADDRLKPIGRSGIWVLSEWEHVETATIKDVIASVLSESDQPLSRDEISEAVQRRRPCSETSIDMYLAEIPEFLLVGYDLYRYRSGASAQDGWNRETLGQWIAEFFVDSASPIVRMKDLARALHSRFGQGEHRLAIILGHHPALVSQRDRSGRVFVTYRENWRDLPPVTQRRAGLSEQLDELLEELLEESPFLPLQDVVNLMSEELGSPPSSLYTYLRNSTVCQTYEDQGQKWICRPDDWQETVQD